MSAKILAAAAIAASLLATPAAAQDSAEEPEFAPRVDFPTCTREELEELTTAYVEAQRTGDLSGLPILENAHFLENFETVERNAGMWNTALPIAHSMSFHDDTRCKTFTEIIVTEGETPHVIGTRLFVDNGTIHRVDSIVTEPGNWLFNANAYLLYSSQEDWSELHPYQRTDPAEMIRGANAYLDAFADKHVDIPWGVPCARLEGGAYTNRDGDPDASCEVGIPPGVLYIVERDYLIDWEHGVINVFCRFGNSEGAPDSHTFRYVDGRFRLIHTLNPIPGPQAADDGSVPGFNPNAEDS